MGELRQQSVNGSLSSDAESGYAATKLFLSKLAIPDRVISEFSDEELDFFTRSDSIAAFSGDGMDKDVNMRQIIAMHTTGRMRLYSDIEWSSLPKDRYSDFISISWMPEILRFYENALLTVSYNGITKQLSPEKDYQIIINDFRGQVGVKFDFKKALKGVKKVDKNGVRIHFEIDVFKAGPHEYSSFNLYLHYQHLHTPYDGITKIGNFKSKLGYEYNEKSIMSFTYYDLGPSVPLSYFPEGFQKPE